MLARRAPLSHRFMRPAPGVADRSLDAELDRRRAPRVAVWMPHRNLPAAVRLHTKVPMESRFVVASPAQLAS